MGKNNSVATIIGYLYFLSVFIFVPLYVENKYFNILQAKAKAVDVILMIMIIAILVLLCLRFRTKAVQHRPAPGLIDLGLLAISCSALISGILSGQFSESFWGLQAWGVGVFMLCGTTIVILFFSRTFHYLQNLWIPVLLVHFFIFLFTILHAAKIDIFAMHKHLIATQYFDYVSTIGNTNWLSGYLCLLLPCILLMFLNSTSKLSNGLYLLALIPGSINVILCNSDGFYLGVGVCAFFAFPYIFREKQRTERFFLTAALFGCCLGVIRLLPFFTEKRTTMSGITARFLGTPGILLWLILGFLGFLLCKKFYPRLQTRGVFLLTLAAEILLACTALLFLLHTIRSFDSGFGTDRGIIWKTALAQFRNFPMLRKLFGTGPELIGSSLAQLSEVLPRRVLSVHSQPLQFLTTTGLLGFAGWCLLWGTIIRQFFKKKLWTSDTMIFFLPLIAYWGQSLVNTSMALTLSVFSVFLICYRTRLSSDDPSGT